MQRPNRGDEGAKRDYKYSELFRLRRASQWRRDRAIFAIPQRVVNSSASLHLAARLNTAEAVGSKRLSKNPGGAINI